MIKSSHLIMLSVIFLLLMPLVLQKKNWQSILPNFQNSSNENCLLAIFEA